MQLDATSTAAGNAARFVLSGTASAYFQPPVKNSTCFSGENANF
jgi:hypothetical protein